MEKVSDFRLIGAEADEEIAELPICHRCIEGKKVFANPVLEASCNQTSILDLSNDAGDENQGFQRTKTRPQVFEQRVLLSELPNQRANTDIALGEAAFRRSTLLDFLNVFRRSQTFAALGGRLLRQRSRHVAALEEAAVFGIGIVAAVDHAAEIFLLVVALSGLAVCALFQSDDMNGSFRKMKAQIAQILRQIGDAGEVSC